MRGGVFASRPIFNAAQGRLPRPRNGGDPNFRARIRVQRHHPAIGRGDKHAPVHDQRRHLRPGETAAPGTGAGGRAASGHVRKSFGAPLRIGIGVRGGRGRGGPHMIDPRRRQLRRIGWRNFLNGEWRWPPLSWP
jgi:hypothetical protein